MSEQRPLLVLMDGHAVAYRAYFAMNAKGFTTDSGEPTNATYGFTRALMDVLDKTPDYFAISFDMGLSGRETVFPDYKGTREKMPDDLSIQLGRIDQVVRAFNIPVLAVPGFEADDIIGTVTKQAEAQGCEVLILTGDRDILQLLSQHTRVQLPQRNDDDKIWGVGDFKEAYEGLNPIQLIDLKGIMGDNSDNIPGVDGIGKVGALKLISTYGSLEGVYEHIEEIKGKQREYLERDRELAFLSKSLATIMLDVAIELDLEACVTHDYDAGEVVKIFREVEFRQLMSRLEKMHRIAPEEAVILEQGSAIEMEVITVDTPAKLDELVETLNHAKWIAFDTETTGLRPMEAKLVGISLAVDSERGYYIPVGHISPNAPEGMIGGVNEDGTMNQKITQNAKPKQAGLFDVAPESENLFPPQLSLESVIAAIRPALTHPDIQKMAHNADFDLIMLRRYGIDVQPIGFDTMIAQWVRYPDSRNLGLKALVSTKLKKTMQEIETLIGKGAKQISFARVPIEHAAPYATADSAMLHLLRPALDDEFETDAMRELFHTMEMPLTPLIADMEMTGVLIDVDHLKGMSVDLNERSRQLQQEIYETSGYGEFNINSMHQLNDILFGKLQIPNDKLKKTKKTGNVSLTADVLEEMAGQHPVIDLILEYRQINKLISTYVDALPALINPRTGRVHTSYNQTGAVTGRFSSNDPNLQNIPIRTEEGRLVRKAFIADKGNVLLSADYSQIELRLLAHFADDEAMITAFREGVDIHRRTAATVFHIPLDEVTFEQRSFAKSVNFGLMYGMSAFRLANDAGISRREASQFVEEYFASFPGVKAYLDASKEWANEKGYVETLFGRRRYFPELLREGKDKPTVVQRQRQEREAINAPIQGTAADLLKMAMLNLDAALKREGYPAKLILQVHDELVLEVAESHLDVVLPIVKDIMENVHPLKAPLRTEAKVGLNWYDMKSV